MKHETTTSSAREEEGGGTATMQPLPVSDELISRLAGKCEEIFPLNDRLRHEISDEEIREMESLLKRLRPAPARVLFREHCCSLMCSESEREMETRLKKLSASSMLEFSVCKMAHAMDSAGKTGTEKAAGSSVWRRLVYISGISVAAAVGVIFLVQNALEIPGDAVAGNPEHGADSGNAEAPALPGKQKEPFRKASIFELQGGDERVPVLAPAVIRKILPEKEY